VPEPGVAGFESVFCSTLAFGASGGRIAALVEGAGDGWTEVPLVVVAADVVAVAVVEFRSADSLAGEYFNVIINRFGVLLPADFRLASADFAVVEAIVMDRETRCRCGYIACDGVLFGVLGLAMGMLLVVNVWSLCSMEEVEESWE
jgi:hypothetical protein